MRLGGPLFTTPQSPDTWIADLQHWGYRAAICPLNAQADNATIRAYERAAQQAQIVIAEVGAWQANPLSPDPQERQRSIRFYQEQLALADAIGARCCVGLSGSHSSTWDHPHPANLTEETFTQIVDVARQIIDAVKPRRTVFTLEAMPWIYPDSPECYLRLLQAIDRPQFAVHLDPVNMINSPERYYRNGAFIRECVRLLGPWIKSCHAKDITLETGLTVHLNEIRPGQGALDYATLLHELHRIDPDMPLILEHLADAEAYRAAGAHIRGVAEQEQIPL